MDVLPVVKYTVLPKCNKYTLDQCAHLFSNHYAIWDTNKKRVKLTSEKLRNEYMFDDRCMLAIAQINDEIIGQCFTIKDKHDIIWITQLVVHENYRRRGIAKELLHLSLQKQWNIVCMATSNPYSIQALQSVLNITFHPQPDLAQFVLQECPVPYLYGKSYHISGSTINTEFYICHEEVNKIIKNKLSEQTWIFASELPHGHEFFVVFKSNYI